jgi:hypothetical protein
MTLREYARDVLGIEAVKVTGDFLFLAPIGLCKADDKGDLVPISQEEYQETIDKDIKDGLIIIPSIEQRDLEDLQWNKITLDDLNKVVEGLQNDMLEPCIQRIFEIMQNNGLFDAIQTAGATESNDKPIWYIGGIGLCSVDDKGELVPVTQEVTE